MRPTTITSSGRGGDDSGTNKIQDYLIASIQNLGILLKHYQPKRSAAAALRLAALESFYTLNNNFALIPRRV